MFIQWGCQSQGGLTIVETIYTLGMAVSQEGVK